MEICESKRGKPESLLVKTFLVCTLFLFITCRLTAQSGEMQFYYPDGTPYKRVCKSIADINRDFDQSGRIKTYSPLCWDATRYDCFVVIGFKLFTDQPLWIFTNSSQEFGKLVKAFDYRKYLMGYQFEHDLAQHILKQTLNDVFILETLGHPDERIKKGDGDNTMERWTYHRLKLVLIMNDGLVSSYQRLK